MRVARGAVGELPVSSLVRWGWVPSLDRRNLGRWWRCPGGARHASQQQRLREGPLRWLEGVLRRVAAAHVEADLEGGKDAGMVCEARCRRRARRSGGLPEAVLGGRELGRYPGLRPI